MRRYTFFSLAMLFLLAPLTFAHEPKSRSYNFEYEVTLTEIPQNSQDLKIWIPYLPDTRYQMIEDVKITPENNSAITYDKTYHNKIINYAISSPQESSLKINIQYKITRLEFTNKPGMTLFDSDSLITKDDLQKYLKADRLVTISPKIQQMADEITKNKLSAIEKAQAIYDYVFENVAYDKSIPGWGQGDTERVCLIKAGNCTDFHSLFISLARASGIPAKFVIGVPVAQEHEGQIKGYHCWAEFYDAQLGWIPVDISEAWKKKERKEYFFGALDENRLEFTQGRDIILEPTPNGEPLNYFLYPYAEIDGKEFKNIEVLFKYRDLSSEVKSIPITNDVKI